MTERNWEFEIALLVFIGFFIAALFLIGTEIQAVHAVLDGPRPA